ncbi:MAG: hypothetical protein M1819_003710 [Sarea resinae]|nr:MAG: hypothetical protein M1819_003710 [Sarea resinae]
MSAEPDLPPLPSGDRDPPRAFKLDRKRALEDNITTSSDPPLFSSDDLPNASVENYSHGQRKRQYRGTWWGEEVRPTGRREFKRNLDSGVWMSEGTDISSDPQLEELDFPGPHHFGLPVVRTASEGETGDSHSPRGAAVDIASPSAETSQEHNNAATDSPERRAEQIIQTCVENGQEHIDLSGLQLTSLSSDIIKPLHYLTVQPKFEDYPSDSDSDSDFYSPLTPSLTIDLSGNQLRTIPREIFALENLEALNVSGNQLTELPSGFGRFDIRLNVSSNQLRWLSHDMKMKMNNDMSKMTLASNPFLAPLPSSQSDLQGSTSEHALPVQHNKDNAPAFVASTQVAFLNVDGSRHRSSPIPPSWIVGHCLETQREDHEASLPDEPPSQAPSLLELTLRGCSRSSNLHQLPDLLGPEAPLSVIRHLQRTAAIKEAGGQSCAACGKSFEIPRTEWIEWYDYASQDDPAKEPSRIRVLAVDLLNPTPQAEARKHKLKTLVPAPRSFFMDVKCPGCFTITTVFSHAQTVVICGGCSTVLCQPTGGKARLTEGCSFRRK